MHLHYVIAVNVKARHLVDIAEAPIIDNINIFEYKDKATRIPMFRMYASSKMLESSCKVVEGVTDHTSEELAGTCMKATKDFRLCSKFLSNVNTKEQSRIMNEYRKSNIESFISIKETSTVTGGSKQKGEKQQLKKGGTASHSGQSSKGGTSSRRTQSSRSGQSSKGGSQTSRSRQSSKGGTSPRSNNKDHKCRAISN